MGSPHISVLFLVNGIAKNALWCYNKCIIDTNKTSDPRIGTTTENFELWASNEEGTDYYYSESDIYDVNDNLNISEKVHKSTTAVSLVAPNSL